MAMAGDPPGSIAVQCYCLTEPCSIELRAVVPALKPDNYNLPVFKAGFALYYAPLTDDLTNTIIIIPIQAAHSISNSCSLLRDGTPVTGSHPIMA
jgi:hypothetical protein